MGGGRAYVGTSGWHYSHWVGPFYPAGTSGSAYLSHYMRWFRTVEINNTFYQLPARATLAAWREATPTDFVFACKASRYITHMKKLTDPERSTTPFFETIAALGTKLGPVLFQLPPRWSANPPRLESFLETLPPGNRFAFEFRDESWFGRDTCDVLAAHNAAFCIYDLAGRRSPLKVTADFAYIRLHGPAGPYRGRYGRRNLRHWAREFSTWLHAGKDVYCYFDNDENGFAVQDALVLRELIEGR
jgi:uncharacterized protein YecE (DUF72 family)